MGNFINFTNHPSDKWDEKQTKAAESFGPIIDVTFPTVNSKASEEDIEQLTQKYLKEIIEMQPSCVLCQGEFTLCFNVVNKLKQKGIRVVSACSERNVVEQGEKKIAIFHFVKFREY